jgi:NitT/TauT family transport system substrate-binding protein
MGPVRLIRHRWPGYLLALAIAFAVPAMAQTSNNTQAPGKVPTAAPPPAPAGPPRVRFSLDGRLEGPSATFLLPLERGYFKAAGIQASIEEAATPMETITRVASGNYDMGFADINAMIKHRDQNPASALKAVFMVYNTPPYAIVARKSRGITEPKQLEGKKLGAPPTGATVGEWALFAKLNGIDPSKVTIENIAIPVRVPMLAAGQIDAALGFSFRVYIDLKDRGVPVDDIVLMLMANYGMKLYGNAIIVNPKFAAEKPDAVKAFLSAYLRGLKETIRRPADAIDLTIKREDAARNAVELERLRMAIRDNILTPEVKADGYGTVNMTRLEEAIAQLALTHTFKVRPKAEDVFDPSFLPPAADRKVH